MGLLPCAQNPDPKAHVNFAEYITKAYQALTDEVSRQNYEKYGHPDGQQVRMEAAGVDRIRAAEDQRVWQKSSLPGQMGHNV